MDKCTFQLRIYMEHMCPSTHKMRTDIYEYEARILKLRSVILEHGTRSNTENKDYYSNAKLSGKCSLRQ